MSKRRFYSPDLSGSRVELDDQQSDHARKTLRLQAGDTVELFDGQGREAPGVVEAAKKGVIIAVSGEITVIPRPRLLVDVGAAVPKGPRADTLVEKLCELGADRFIPLSCQRSVVEPGANKLDKWRRTVIETAKQCGRSWLMQVTDINDFKRAIALPGYNYKLFADLEGRPGLPPILPAVLPRDWQKLQALEEEGGIIRLHKGEPSPPSPTHAPGATSAQGAPKAGGTSERLLVLVGPEGGWTEQERRQALDAGFNPWRLGPYTLRVETAAMAAAGLLRAISEGW